MENQLELPILGHSSHLYIEESSGTSEHSGGYSPPPRWVGESDTKRYGHLYRYYRYYWQEGDSGSRRTRWRHIPGGRVGTALGDARAEAVRGAIASGMHHEDIKRMLVQWNEGRGANYREVPE
ncbi:MAG: hypothetical protein HC832_00590 [Leptolyngbyaceae cyanobacterium RM1_405_57]|nr:hypothetical protein [Leptolyngbyaceae cyanobacterium RM1_405_57]